MRDSLKRLPLLLLLVFPLVLAACSDPAPSPEVQGRWASTTLPLTLTVDRDYNVANSDFHLEWDGGFLDYTVSTRVTGNSLTVTAVASTADATLTFRLNASVDGDIMRGDYSLVGVTSGGSEFLRASGSFSASRVD